MFPTDIGTVVTDFLVLNFKDILDYNFTAYVEKEFDDIANGELKWNKMLEEFYVPFHKTVELTEKESERASGERILFCQRLQRRRPFHLTSHRRSTRDVDRRWQSTLGSLGDGACEIHG